MSEQIVNHRRICVAILHPLAVLVLSETASATLLSFGILSYCAALTVSN